MKQIKITAMHQLLALPDETKIQIVGSSKDRWILRTPDGMFLVDDGGGSDLSQEFIDRFPMIAFLTTQKPTKKKLIRKMTELSGIADGTPVEFGIDDRERHIYGCDGKSDVLVIDDGGGFTLDQRFLDGNPIYIALVNRSDLKKGVRFSILKRDHFRCRTCGATANDGAKLEVDHKIPIAKGGDHSIQNLWTLCYDCNRGKGTRSV